MGERIASVIRKTKETDISVKLNIDGTGKADIETGIGFFDHMLEAFAKHGLFDLEVKVKGDLNVDGHHTVEDTGIVLGQALLQAIGEKKVSDVMEVKFFQWTNPLFWPLWIFAEDHIL